MFLPWNMPLASSDVSRPTGVVPAELTVWPAKEPPVSTSFWIRPKAQPRSAQTLLQSDKSITLVSRVPGFNQRRRGFKPRR